MAAVGWWAYTMVLGDPGGQTGSVMTFVLLAAAILIGAWIGATLSCTIAHDTNVEDTCYGGMLGGIVYLLGGVLGALLGRLSTHATTASMVVWYLAGGTIFAVLALYVTMFSPCARRMFRAQRSEAPDSNESHHRPA
jgi:uncharacterized membrane protein YedE/YeeE